MPSIHDYQDFFNRSPLGVPVVSVHYDQTIYQQNLPLLLDLPESLSDSIIALYSDLKMLETEADAIRHPGFVTISRLGREALLVGINTLQETTSTKARGLLKELVLVTEQK